MYDLMENLKWKKSEKLNNLLKNYAEKISKRAAVSTYEFTMRMPKIIAETIQKRCDQFKHKVKIDILEKEISNDLKGLIVCAKRALEEQENVNNGFT